MGQGRAGTGKFWGVEPVAEFENARILYFKTEIGNPKLD
jgi:hypothetical protein